MVMMGANEHGLPMSDKIDDIDATMLRRLQAHGRMKRTELAEIVDLTVPSVSERIRKLEARDVITGYHATVDAKRLGLDITSFIRVTVDGSEHYPPFIEAVTAMDEVLEMHSVTGEGSHILKVRTRNTTTLERLLARLQALAGVHGTSTSVILSTYKESRTVPVAPDEPVPA